VVTGGFHLRRRLRWAGKPRSTAGRHDRCSDDRRRVSCTAAIRTEHQSLPIAAKSRGPLPSSKASARSIRRRFLAPKTTRRRSLIALSFAICRTQDRTLGDEIRSVGP